MKTDIAYIYSLTDPETKKIFMANYITRTLFTTTEPIGKFMYPYEHPRQLNAVINKLKSLF